ncbi:MAG: hypothetical protein K2M16_07125 [Muribaculaceae bacterium]|nr:hypothetical protein [Muribaculaceae bacterium]
MKISLLAFSAACVALSGMAATPRQQQRHAAPSFSFDRNVELKTDAGLAVRHKGGMKKAPSKINSPEDVITSVEGRRQDMTLVGSGFYVGWDLMEYEDQEVATHVVYGDSDEVYIFNIMPNMPTESYVKGIKEGDKVTVSLPQTVIWDDDYEDGANVNICDFYEFEEDGELYFDYIPVEGATLVFTVAEDGSMKAEDLSFEHMLGLTYCTDDSWSGYGVWDLSLAPFTGSPVTVPSDIEVSKDFWNYTCEYLGYGWPVSFAQGGEEIYFQGLSEVMPEAWVKATVEYDDTEAHVFIDQNQFVGVNLGAYVYTKCAKILVDEEYGYEYYELLPDDYRFELIWDYEAETMTVKDPTVSLLFNRSKVQVDYADEMYEFVLRINDGYEGTPANPYGLYFYDYMDYFGYSVFEFYLPALSTEGGMLATSDLSYVVYVDGEEWTFDGDDYLLDEPVVEIPWDFDNEETILKWFGTCKHAVYMFVEGISSLGVQSVYRYGGEETRSEIVTFDLDPSGVAAPDSDRKVADVKYFDLSGRQVASPAAGIFVKRVTFEDGTVATFKKAIK